MSTYPTRQNPGQTRTPPYRVSCCPDCQNLMESSFASRRRYCLQGGWDTPVAGAQPVAEVKCRAAGFRQLYDWLNQRDVLIVKADHQEPLVVLRMSLAAEIAKSGNGVPSTDSSRGNRRGPRSL